MEDCTLNKREIVIIKIGSNVLASQTEGVKLNIMQSLATEIAWLHKKKGISSGVVSSGAVSCGGSSSIEPLARQKVAAAIGQLILMQKWQESFNYHNLRTSQVIGSRDEFKHDETIETLELLIAEGNIPIINENDSVATQELVALREHGDNDILAAIVAINLSASRLIILTDVEGLCIGGSPRLNSQAKIISRVTKVTDEILALAKDSEADQASGMFCKLTAIKEATEHGIDCQLANGNRSNIISELFGENPPGTFFEAQLP